MKHRAHGLNASILVLVFAAVVAGQSRGTQRYESRRRADQDRLTAAVVALASE